MSKLRLMLHWRKYTLFNSVMILVSKRFSRLGESNFKEHHHRMSTNCMSHVLLPYIIWKYIFSVLSQGICVGFIWCLDAGFVNMNTNSQSVQIKSTIFIKLYPVSIVNGHFLAHHHQGIVNHSADQQLNTLARMISRWWVNTKKNYMSAN